ncbi:MAG: putative transport system, rane protein [Bacteroidetes bacterium]|jgi:putative ABC transport system permease protein|nr:putative transport system, rane protein [Bacteroidota bacterium]
MKELYYAFRTLIRGKGANVIKVISLTLGLLIGILLFARMAFEMSYDNFYHESDKLCIINAIYNIDGKKKGPLPVVMGPVPAAIAEAFPQEIESATLVYDWYGSNALFNGSVRFQPKVISADSLFFQTMGIKVLRGDVKEMRNPDVLFLSASFAHKVFGDEDPIGKTLMYNKTVTMIVKGVYADIPENSTLRHDVVISFVTLLNHHWQRSIWNGEDSFLGYVRLHNTSDISKINPRIRQVIEQYMPYKPDSGFDVTYSLQPLREMYIGSKNVQQMVLIISLLGFSILFIAAMNYVLISVSSLSYRAKAIGVHKCNGATNANISSMFLWETVMIIVLSLMGVAFILINFKDKIEDVASATLGALFTWQSLWVPALVVVFLFIVAGLLPARLFSSIPVTQVFRRYTEGKRNWKRPLLFVQFSGVAFILGLMCVVLIQYHYVMNKDLGYDPQRVAYVYHSFESAEDGKDNLQRLPMVESVSGAISDLLSGFWGDGITNESGKNIFTVRYCYCDYDYLPLLGIQLTEGQNINGPNQLLVNEEFVRCMHWKDSPIGKKPKKRDEAYGTIVGVMKDFPVNRYGSIPPVMLIGQQRVQNCWHVKLKEPFDSNLKAINQAMLEMYPTEDILFKSLSKAVEDQYLDVRRFRDAVVLASISILLITLMGLFGYVNDEIRRRSKEIAIRKVNGAKVEDVLTLISKDIVWTAISAVVLGTICSYVIGVKWLEQFSEKIELSVLLFIAISLFILLLIFICVIIKSWRIANANPVKSIKAE